MLNSNILLEEIGKKADLNKEECILVMKALNDNFFISKRNKKATINGIINNIKCDFETATLIYNTCVDIIRKEIKNIDIY